MSLRPLLPILILAGLMAAALAEPGADDERISPPVEVTSPEDPPAPEVVMMAEPPATFAPPPDTFPPETNRALLRIAGSLEQGLTGDALERANRAVATMEGRGRDAALLAVGLLSTQQGRWPEAATALAEVAAGEGPLAPWGSYHLAELSLDHGEPSFAATECQTYRSRWPRGPHASECTAIQALAFGQLGQAEPARAAAASWRAIHRWEPLDEAVDLALATWEIRHAPGAAGAHLQRLAVDFSAPLTGRRAEALLEQLDRQAGSSSPGTLLPDDSASACARAISLRDTGRLDEAWTLFRRIQGRAVDDPSLRPWIDAQLPTFARATRQWDELETWYQDRFQRQPTSDVAWDAWRSAARGGRYDAARWWMREGIARWGHQSPWHDQGESLGRTLLIGGWHDEAAAMFERRASDTSSTGRRNLFLASFAWWRAGQPELASAGFARLIQRPGAWDTEAHYWRARMLAQASPGHPDRLLADLDEQWVLSRQPDSWYALLIRDRHGWQEPPDGAPRLGRVHTGTWPGAAAPPWWPLVPYDDCLDACPPPGFQVAWQERPITAFLPPLSYAPGPFHQPEEAADLMDRLAETWGGRWPSLVATADLARVGLYDLSGPLMASWYGEYLRASSHRESSARQVNAQLGERGMLQLFMHTRDHHHTARLTWGLHAGLTDAQDRLSTERLEFPVAFGAEVWAASRRAALDPFLALSIMRAESTYNPNAVSRAGARGPMQIMPRTGHLLADLAGDTDFTPRNLHNPVLAVDYGITYLGLLNERFEGVFPLAVAAYNSGPHNVSAWMEGLGPGTPLDVFVESIPFTETRDYVRKVSVFYEQYARLYERAIIDLPEATAGDHPGVVDF